MKKSRLKSRPDVIDCPDGNGGRLQYLASDWLLGYCEHCNNKFLLESNIGYLTCPYGCGSDKISLAWGKPRIVFLQENELRPMKVR